MKKEEKEKTHEKTSAHLARKGTENILAQGFAALLPFTSFGGGHGTRLPDVNPGAAHVPGRAPRAGPAVAAPPDHAGARSAGTGVEAVRALS